MKKRDCALALVVAVIAFGGYWLENIWLLLVSGRMDNRGMLLPFLLGHGLVFVGFFRFLGLPCSMHLGRYSLQRLSPWIQAGFYFLLVSFCISLGELALGTLVERLCGFSWWDYSQLPLHLTQYTSLPTSVAFGALVVLLMQWLFPPLYRFFLRWHPSVLHPTAVLLLTVMGADFVFAGLWMFTYHGTRLWWSLTL